MLFDGLVNSLAGVFRAHGEHSGELQATEKANRTVVAGTTVFLEMQLNDAGGCGPIWSRRKMVAFYTIPLQHLPLCCNYSSNMLARDFQ